MSKARTKALQFDKKVIAAICMRDKQCIFCEMNYHMEGSNWLLLEIKDPMHYVNKSAGGLGIEENGAIGCRYHHGLLDNGNKGVRAEMLDLMREYLKSKYPGWDESKLRYNKYSYMEVGKG